jgi:hypothetical protein
MGEGLGGGVPVGTILRWICKAFHAVTPAKASWIYHRSHAPAWERKTATLLRPDKDIRE